MEKLLWLTVVLAGAARARPEAASEEDGAFNVVRVPLTRMYVNGAVRGVLERNDASAETQLRSKRSFDYAYPSFGDNLRRIQNEMNRLFNPIPEHFSNFMPFGHFGGGYGNGEDRDESGSGGVRGHGRGGFGQNGDPNGRGSFGNNGGHAWGGHHHGHKHKHFDVEFRRNLFDDLNEDTSLTEESTVPSENDAGNANADIVARVHLQNFLNVCYFGMVSIGNQVFKMLFDTGSANIWVPSSRCSIDDGACQKHAQYNAANSISFEPSAKNFSIKYGTGKVEGSQGYDTIELFEGIRIERQEFGQATSLSKEFSKLKFDGIFGLAFQQIAECHAESAIDNMKKQNLINRRVFSLRIHSDVEETQSELIIGGVDEGSYWPPLRYHPILDGGYWRLFLDHITETSNTIEICPNGCNAIVDTGTSLMAAPWKVVDALNTKIMQAKYSEITKNFVLDCERLPLLPNITISIDSQPYVLTPYDYVLKVGSGSDWTCSSAFMPSGKPNGDSIHRTFTFILGDPFLRLFYTVFDMENRMVGFAKSRREVVNSN